MRRADHLIVGGGPAGAAAAILLARQSARPVLLERHVETPDSLCGGFLSWRSCRALDSLGLDAAELGGWPIDRLRLFAEGTFAETALPAAAIGLSRRRLDHMLLAQAERGGTRVERGVHVTHGAPDRVDLSDGGVITCDRLYLATGKHDCRGLARKTSRPSDPFIGLRLRIPAGAVLRRLVGSAVEIHLFAGGYAGLLLQEDGSGNLCLAVRKSRLSAAGGDPAALIGQIAARSPELGDRLSTMASNAAIDAIGPIPYGWREKRGAAGLFRLGDQAAVIPSFAGEGIGIALASGMLAARYHAQSPALAPPIYQASLARRTRWPLAVSAIMMPLLESGFRRRMAVRALSRAPALATLVARLTRIGP